MTQVVMRRWRSRRSWRRASLPLACWLLLIGLVLAPATLRAAADPAAVSVATAELQTAIGELTDSLNDASEEVRIEVGAEIRLMLHGATRVVDRLRALPVPPLSAALAGELQFVADILKAAQAELQQSADSAGENADAALADRIGQLGNLTHARLEEIDGLIDDWQAKTANAIVEVDTHDGMIVVRSIDHAIYNVVRFASLFLLLAGLLVIGVQLLRMSGDRVAYPAMLRESPVVSSAGIVVLAAFLLAALLFTVRPGIVAALATETSEQPQEHPCDRLERQREHLRLAKATGNAGLISAVKRRMQDSAQDCLGLPSEFAAIEAVERLAARVVPATVAMPPAQATAPEVMAEVAAPVEAGAPAEETAPAKEDALEELLATLREPPLGTEQTAEEAGAPGEAEAQPTEEAPPEAATVEEATEPEVTEEVAAVEEPAEEPVTVVEPRLFVTITALNYRAGPGLDAPRLGTLIEGAQVQVIGEEGGWAKIRLRDGREVYVAKEYLRPAG